MTKPNERVEPDYFPNASNARKDCKQRRKRLSSSSGSSVSIPSTPPPADRKSIGTHPRLLRSRSTELGLPWIQAMKKHITLAGDYRTWRLADRSRCYDETVSSYIAKLMKMTKLQLRLHFFDSKKSVFIIILLLTSKVACNSNKIHKGPAMLVLLTYVQETLVNSLESRMYVKDRLTPFAASV